MVKSPSETLSKWRIEINFREHDYAPADVKFLSKNKVRVEFDNIKQRDETVSGTDNDNLQTKAGV